MICLRCALQNVALGTGVVSKPLLTAGFIYLFTRVHLSALLGMKPVDAWAEVKSVRWTAMGKY